MSAAMSDTFLSDALAELIALYSSDEVLGGFPILHERQGDIDAELKKSLGLVTGVNGKIGACLVIQKPTADDNMPAAEGGILDAEWSTLVLEEPLLNDGTNGHQMDALTIARRVLRVAKNYRAEGLFTSLVPMKPAIVPAAVRDESGNLLASISYAVRLRCTENSSGVPKKVSTPALAPKSTPNNALAAPQTVTITCATASADIYYTLDGSPPWDGNGSAILYSAPVNVIAAGTLRARAFKAGFIGSNAASADFV